MKLIDSITVQQPNKTAKLQLFHGDLSAIPPEQKVDILVVSAFPNNYVTLPGSLVLALEEKGLSMNKLAQNKSEDLRVQLGCWLSKPIPEDLQAKLNFRQVLCFEPGDNSNDATEVVGNIFRCLNNFVYDETVTRVALPVIATGYQKVPFDKMFPVLIDTAIFWLQQGLPLESINIVIKNEAFIGKAVSVFNQASGNLPALKPAVAVSGGIPVENLQPPRYSKVSDAPAVPPTVIPQNTGVGIQNSDLNYFISYAHTQSVLIQHFVEILLKTRPGLKIFYDKTNILPGGLWLRQISDAISQAEKVLIFMSPDYSASMVCWDEFQCAKLKEYNDKTSVIQTIYLTTDPKLPPIMGIHSYIDCREGDLTKLAVACEQLLS